MEKIKVIRYRKSRHKCLNLWRLCFFIYHWHNFYSENNPCYRIRYEFPLHAPARRTRLSTLQEVPPTPFSTICFSCFSRPLGQTQKTIDVLFGRYIPTSPKLKKKPKNLDFWKQTWYNTKRKIRKACLQPQTGGFRQASLVTFSGCSAVGSARGLGPRCRRFESCHSDHAECPYRIWVSCNGHSVFLFSAKFILQSVPGRSWQLRLFSFPW